MKYNNIIAIDIIYSWYGCVCIPNSNMCGDYKIVTVLFCIKFYIQINCVENSEFQNSSVRSVEFLTHQIQWVARFNAWCHGHVLLRQQII